MNMKRGVFFAISTILILACALTSGLQPPVESTPANAPTMITAYSGGAARATPTSTPSATQAAYTPAVFPRWVAEFSEPLLKSIEMQRPAFSDDFPPVCIDENRNWKTCATPESRIYFQPDHMDEYEWEQWAQTIPRPTLSIEHLPLATARPTLDLQPDLQNGYALLNTGWFFNDPGAEKNPLYAHINNGALVLNLPEGTLRNDIAVFHSKLPRKNFALQLDLDFYETQPGDTARFEFKQGGDESFALDIAKNKTWALHWGSASNPRSRAGTYEYYALPQVRVLIIAYNTQCAVYLNSIPLEYIENCRSDLDYKITPQSAFFHLLSDAQYPAMITIDNIAVWELKE
jgi:hypothetical protein